MAQLIEFKNHKKEVLRGILDKAVYKNGVIFVHGFERTTIEYKFKNIVDRLRKKTNLFRFDFSGCGLSCGLFEDMTVEKMSKELRAALKVFKKNCPAVKNIILVAHSLGACVVVDLLRAGFVKDVKKIVFLAPALNQRDLLRYWFAKSQPKHNHVSLNWNNFKQYLSEADFQADLREKRRMTREHWLLNGYYLEGEKINYQELLAKINFDFNNLLVIYGDSDDKVPSESNANWPASTRLIVAEGGDHNLERPDVVGKYLNEVVTFTASA